MAKPIKAKRNIKDNQNKEQKNEIFSFDNEIVIGVTKKQEQPKKEVKHKKKEDKKVHKKNITNKENKIEKVKNKEENKEKNKKTVKKNIKKANRKIKNNKNEQEKTNKKKIRMIHTVKYGVIALLFIAVILCAMFSPLFNIKNVKVEGNGVITENEIISLSQIQKGENTFKLSKNKIIKQIKENTYIENVVIERKLPSNIIIKIEERKPAYLLEYAGSYVYVDKKGYMLEISTEKLELPILQGGATITEDFVPGNRMCLEDLEKLSTVHRIMEVALTNEIANIITKIDIENEQNLKLIIESKEKVAYLGDSSNLMEKIPIIKKIMEEEEGKAGEIFVNMDLNKENPMFRERV